MRTLLDVLTALQLTEHSLSLVVDDLDEVRLQQKISHEAVIRLQEQVQQLKDNDLTNKNNSTYLNGQQISARATIVASVVGAIAGIMSLLISLYHR